MRKHWKVLAGALPAIILIVSFLLIQLIPSNTDVYNNPERVAEILAGYRRDMEAKPSAKTAEKTLEFAIASGQPELVYTVLKENIYPWAETEGVGAEFIRGSKWYINNKPQADNVLWLAEAIHHLNLIPQFNDDLADYYLTLEGLKAVQCGNILFANWTLNEKARQQYLSSLSGLWVSGNLPIQPGGTFDGIELIDGQNLIPLVDVPEFEDVSRYLHLWITCWRGNLDEEFVNSLLQLSPKTDPLDLYRRLWAVALLRDLGEKWHNPLGLDVAAKLPVVFPQLGEGEIDILYSRRDLKSPEQNLLLLELLAARPEVGTMWEREVAAMLVNAAGYEESELDKIIFPGQYRAASADVVDVFNRLSQHYAGSKYFQRAEAILGLATLENEEPEVLWALAEEWFYLYNQGQEAPKAKEGIQTIIKYLSKKPQWSKHAAALSAALNPPPAPTPTLIFNPKDWWAVDWYHMEYTDLSPDSSYLFYIAIDSQYVKRGDIVDMATGQLVLNIPESKNYADRDAWSRDSRYFALETKNNFAVYDLSTRKRLAQVAPVNAEAKLRLLGWTADNSLLWVEHANSYQIVSYSPATGERQEIGSSTTAYPAFTATGQVAYLEGVDEYGWTKDTLKVTVDGITRSYKVPEARVEGWLPEDAGIQLKKMHEDLAVILDLASEELTPLDVKRFLPLPKGWVNRYQVYGNYLLEEGEDFWDTSAVMLMDIRDLSVTATGITNTTPFGGRIFFKNTDTGLFIYKMFD